jgi:hypothetical protein
MTSGELAQRGKLARHKERSQHDFAQVKVRQGVPGNDFGRDLNAGGREVAPR